MLDDDDALPDQLPGSRAAGREAQQKLGETFLNNLSADWAKHGVATIEKVRAEKPEQYLRLMAAVLPNEFDIHKGLFEDVTDDELAATHAYVKNALGLRASREDGKAPPED